MAINWNTILSSFNDKPTLMQWLKKVEEALKNASIESISVEQSSATEVYYRLHFADGTTLDSPTITLPRGEQGEKGDTGATGNGIASVTRTSTSGLIDTYTILFTDGTTTTFNVTNGEKGDKGDTGATGNGIASIALNATSGNVDNYVVTYTNGEHYYFNVTNGVGIVSIAKTSTSGLVDTYTITLTNGTTTSFNVTNGRDGVDGTNGTNGVDGVDGVDGVGIVSIAKTSTSGLVDTYTITLTNGTTTTFDVTNGRDGTNGTNGTNGVDGIGISSITSSQSGNVVTLTITYSDSTTQTITFTSGGGGGSVGVQSITFTNVLDLVSWMNTNADKVQTIEILTTQSSSDTFDALAHGVVIGNPSQAKPLGYVDTFTRDIENTEHYKGIYIGKTYLNEGSYIDTHLFKITTNLLAEDNSDTPVDFVIALAYGEQEGQPMGILFAYLPTQVRQYESNPIEVLYSDSTDIMSQLQSSASKADALAKRIKINYIG